jgi:FAD/FMN-containing dehydrogenase
VRLAWGLAPALGQCPGVGASGVTLGGGLGWLSGRHGASCDNLRSAQVVAADARVLTAGAEQNPDLFWALRGAGAIRASLPGRRHGHQPLPARPSLPRGAEESLRL